MRKGKQRLTNKEGEVRELHATIFVLCTLLLKYYLKNYSRFCQTQNFLIIASSRHAHSMCNT